MEKQAAHSKSKDKSSRDSTKPGTIVAGPEGHAREGSGKAPSGASGKSAKDAERKPAGKS
ncbi:MAG: hypothetical protein J0H80_00925 [Rhizobiales bacterium]|nr:hypothetical protein [Hyphomicrobiales bacterium]